MPIMMESIDHTQNLDSSLGKDQSPEDEHRQDEESEEVELKLHGGERFITFTDAVVAIAMTLLILPLMEAASDMGGDGSVMTVADYFGENGEKVGSLAISFYVVAEFWTGHSILFQRVENFTPRLVWLNFLWMAGVVFLPVSASLLTEAQTSDSNAPIVYIGTILGIAFANLLMCLLIRATPITLKEGERIPGMLMVVSNVIMIFLVALALLVSLLIPSAGSYSLLVLIPRKLLTRAAHRLMPDWKY